MSPEDGHNAEVAIRFVPSRVGGLSDVSEVVVRPDRLELLSGGQWVMATR